MTASFVQKCLICQQVKAEHKKPSGLLMSLQVPEWKWSHITMDFVVAHLQTDGQSERTIQILEDMLRACTLNFGGN